MRKIECITRPQRLDDVLDAVRDAGVSGMTVSDVIGFGRQRGRTESYRGGEYTIQFQKKIRIEIFLADDLVAPVVAAIVKAARTGEVGDGKVFVLDVESAQRIRTGETGDDAL
jgi:nitrogen regulatory protein P-II 1